MLEFKDVTFKYREDDYTMIKNLSFSMKKGDFISIIGASGCGKSTIFRLINGLEKMQSGEIFINEESIKNIKNYSAYMPQKDLLFQFSMTMLNAQCSMLNAQCSMLNAQCSINCDICSL